MKTVFKIKQFQNELLNLESGLNCIKSHISIQDLERVRDCRAMLLEVVNNAAIISSVLKNVEEKLVNLGHVLDND